jgi:hypothetical protein
MSQAKMLTGAQIERISQDYAQMYAALYRISKYMRPDQLRRKGEKLYGLSGEEAVEMAYENILQEAKDGMRAVRKPFAPLRLATAPNRRTEA